MTKFEFEHISDAEIYSFLENGLKVGVSYICKRYCKANNKYLKYYDAKQEPKHIIYLDVNNLYGYAMSKTLPAGRSKGMDPKNLTQINTEAIVRIVVF